MDVMTLINVAKNTQAISAFVSGSGLKEAVSMIVGDVHLEAARFALETSQIAINPRDRINSAVTHLEAAHVSFTMVHRRADNIAAKSFDVHTIACAADKDVWVCCLMALCYVALGEECAVKKCLTLADKAFDNGRLDNYWDDHNIFALFLIGLPLALASNVNPRNISSVISHEELMSRENYQTFKSVLLSTTSAIN
jgi:hypothetical protein